MSDENSSQEIEKKSVKQNKTSSKKSKLTLNIEAEKNDSINEDEEKEVIDENLYKNIKPISLNEIRDLKLPNLIKYAEKLKIDNTANLKHKELIYKIIQVQEKIKPSSTTYYGVLEVLKEGFGFLRDAKRSYTPYENDIYISPNKIKKIGLMTGDTIEGIVRLPKDSEKYLALDKITKINFIEIQKQVNLKHRVTFDNLTPLFPNERINLDSESKDNNSDNSSRIIDLITPIGKGQRALVVAPPRSGKTVLLTNIVNTISTNHPECYIIVLLVDERPEEVTDMIRSVKGEVVSSTFDEVPYRHTQVAEMVLEKAKRLVESKHDVVILLDSITRLARAYNAVVPSSGKVLTGGLDANALQKPKRIFGAARNVEEGGSLTIIATALVDTGSRMDDVIFEEFKGTGNAEMILDRKLADKRIFPAVDITKSGTRKEELIVESNILSKMWLLRRILIQMNDTERMEFLCKKVSQSKNNSDFFDQMNT